MIFKFFLFIKVRLSDFFADKEETIFDLFSKQKTAFLTKEYLLILREYFRFKNQNIFHKFYKFNSRNLK